MSDSLVVLASDPSSLIGSESYQIACYRIRLPYRFFQFPLWKLAHHLVGTILLNG